jgi:hypothetical protein
MRERGGNGCGISRKFTALLPQEAFIPRTVCETGIDPRGRMVGPAKLARGEVALAKRQMERGSIPRRDIATTPQKLIEARRAKTVKQGLVHESGGREAICPTSIPSRGTMNG